MNRVVLYAAAAFTALLGFLTFFTLFASGPSLLVVISLLVLAMFFFGILGALREPPR